MNSRGTPHDHAEAFCVMRYFGADGTKLDIWNSRDGVTPYIFRHPETRVEFRHVEWQRDRYAPGHKPASGDWVFVGLTMERAMERRRAMTALPDVWADMQAHPHFAGRDEESVARELAEGDFDEGRSPDIIRWP